LFLFPFLSFSHALIFNSSLSHSLSHSFSQSPSFTLSHSLILILSILRPFTILVFTFSFFLFSLAQSFFQLCPSLFLDMNKNK
jgi:hypothetical protein